MGITKTVEGSMRIERTLTADPAFVTMAANCFVGMMRQVEFSEVFNTVETVDMPEGESFEFDALELSVAVYHVLLMLVGGDHDAVKDLGKLISMAGGHSVEPVGLPTG